MRCRNGLELQRVIRLVDILNGMMIHVFASWTWNNNDSPVDERSDIFQGQGLGVDSLRIAFRDPLEKYFGYTDA